MLLAAGWAFVLHIFVNYEYFTNRIIYIDELTRAGQGLRGRLGADRAGGDAAGDRLGAAAHGARLPRPTRLLVTSVKLPVLMEQLYLSTEGIFGSTLGVSASYVMLFVLFGAFMERSGTGQLFMDFAMSITGHTAGGPGKVAVVSSSACSAPSRAARWPT
ncbi:MAG: TRAP transporter large permease subunit [Comamonadaceae bacterium]|nr:TRAP transporter large permease subunit [Comamonadaceae bacterium]